MKSIQKILFLIIFLFFTAGLFSSSSYAFSKLEDLIEINDGLISQLSDDVFTDSEILREFFDALAKLDKDQLKSSVKEIPATDDDPKKFEITLKIGPQLGEILDKYLTIKEGEKVTIGSAEKKVPKRYTKEAIEERMDIIIANFVATVLETELISDLEKVKSIIEDQKAEKIQLTLFANFLNSIFFRHVKESIVGSILTPAPQTLLNYIVLLMDEKIQELIDKPKELFDYLEPLITKDKFEIEFPESWIESKGKEVEFKISYLVGERKGSESGTDLKLPVTCDAAKYYFKDQCLDKATCKTKGENIYAYTDTAGKLKCGPCPKTHKMIEKECVLKATECIGNQGYFKDGVCLSESTCSTQGGFASTDQGKNLCAACPVDQVDQADEIKGTHVINLAGECVLKVTECNGPDSYFYQDQCITKAQCKAQSRIASTEQGKKQCSECPDGPDGTHIINLAKECVLKVTECNGPDSYFYQDQCLDKATCKTKGHLASIKDGKNVCAPCPVDQGTHKINENGVCVETTIEDDYSAEFVKIMESYVKELTTRYQSDPNSALDINLNQADGFSEATISLVVINDDLFSKYFSNHYYSPSEEKTIELNDGSQVTIPEDYTEKKVNQYVKDKLLKFFETLLDKDPKTIELVDKNSLLTKVVDKFFKLPEVAPEGFGSITKFDKEKHNFWQSIYLTEVESFMGSNGIEIIKPSTYTKEAMTPYLKKLIKESSKWIVYRYGFLYITEKVAECDGLDSYFYQDQCLDKATCKTKGENIYAYKDDQGKGQCGLCPETHQVQNGECILQVAECSGDEKYSDGKQCVSKETCESRIGFYAYVDEQEKGQCGQCPPNTHNIVDQECLPFATQKQEQDVLIRAIKKQTDLFSNIVFTKEAPKNEPIKLYISFDNIDQKLIDIWSQHIGKNSKIEIDGKQFATGKVAPLTSNDLMLLLIQVIQESIGTNEIGIPLFEEIQKEILGDLPTSPPRVPFNKEDHKLYDFIILSSLMSPLNYNPETIKAYLKKRAEKVEYLSQTMFMYTGQKEENCSIDSYLDTESKCVAEIECNKDEGNYAYKLSAGMPYERRLCGKCPETHVVNDEIEQCVAKVTECSDSKDYLYNDYCVSKQYCKNDLSAIPYTDTEGKLKCGLCPETHEMIGEECILKVTECYYYNGKCLDKETCEKKGIYAYEDEQGLRQCGQCPRFSESGNKMTHNIVGGECLPYATKDQEKAFVIEELKKLTTNEIEDKDIGFKVEFEKKTPENEPTKLSISFEGFWHISQGLEKIINQHVSFGKKIEIDGKQFATGKLSIEPNEIMILLIEESIGTNETGIPIFEEIQRKVLGDLPTSLPIGPFNPKNHKLYDFIILSSLMSPLNYNPETIKAYLKKRANHISYHSENNFENFEYTGEKVEKCPANTYFYTDGNECVTKEECTAKGESNYAYKVKEGMADEQWICGPCEEGTSKIDESGQCEISKMTLIPEFKDIELDNPTSDLDAIKSWDSLKEKGALSECPEMTMDNDKDRNHVLKFQITSKKKDKLSFVGNDNKGFRGLELNASVCLPQTELDMESVYSGYNNFTDEEKLIYETAFLKRKDKFLDLVMKYVIASDSDESSGKLEPLGLSGADTVGGILSLILHKTTMLIKAKVKMTEEEIKAELKKRLGSTSINLDETAKQLQAEGIGHKYFILIIDHDSEFYKKGYHELGGSIFGSEGEPKNQDGNIDLSKAQIESLDFDYTKTDSLFNLYNKLNDSEKELPKADSLDQVKYRGIYLEIYGVEENDTIPLLSLLNLGSQLNQAFSSIYKNSTVTSFSNYLIKDLKGKKYNLMALVNIIKEVFRVKDFENRAILYTDAVKEPDQENLRDKVIIGLEYLKKAGFASYYYLYLGQMGGAPESSE